MKVLISICLLVASAAAEAAVPYFPQPFYLVARAVEGGKIQSWENATVAANSGLFYLNKPTKSTCKSPPNVAGGPEFCFPSSFAPLDTTMFYPISGGELRLFSVLQNKKRGYYLPGQNTYLGIDGYMGFEYPKSHAPSGSFVYGWTSNPIEGTLMYKNRKTGKEYLPHVCATGDGDSYSVVWTVPGYTWPGPCDRVNLVLKDAYAAFVYR